jgi:hypothetical protein
MDDLEILLLILINRIKDSKRIIKTLQTTTNNTVTELQFQQDQYRHCKTYRCASILVNVAVV